MKVACALIGIQPGHIYIIPTDNQSGWGDPAVRPSSQQNVHAVILTGSALLSEVPPKTKIWAEQADRVQVTGSSQETKG